MREVADASNYPLVFGCVTGKVRSPARLARKSAFSSTAAWPPGPNPAVQFDGSCHLLWHQEASPLMGGGRRTGPG
jgi:hypothetical protein